MELNAEATVSIGFGNVNGSKRVVFKVVVNSTMVFVYMDPSEARVYAKSLEHWAGVLEHDPFTPPCEACPKGTDCAVYGEPFKCVKPHAPVDADPVPSFYDAAAACHDEDHAEACQAVWDHAQNEARVELERMREAPPPAIAGDVQELIAAAGEWIDSGAGCSERLRKAYRALGSTQQRGVKGESK
jgi:hypothetical protein